MPKNEFLKKAVEKIKLQTGLKQAEIAEKLGVKSTYLSDMINSRVPLTENMVENIYEIFQVKIEESEQKESENESLNFIPLLPISAQGGRLNDFVISVKDSDCEKVVSPIKGADFAMPVSGDSMAPEYPNGSQVHIKRINERAFIDWGKTYVLDTCNGTVIKQIVPSEKEGYIKCLSINPNPVYAPFEICLEDVYGIYRVMLCLSLK